MDTLQSLPEMLERMKSDSNATPVRDMWNFTNLSKRISSTEEGLDKVRREHMKSSLCSKGMELLLLPHVLRSLFFVDVLYVCVCVCALTVPYSTKAEVGLCS